MAFSLNIGSGQRKFNPPFVNVDINPRWTPDVIADSNNMSMFFDSTADMIVSHHQCEHVGLGEFDGTIRECYRILKPGGSFIVTTPDLRALVHAWVEQKISNYIFGVNLFGAYMNDEADRHKWVMTKEDLQDTLRKAAPWRAVGEFDWRPISGASIARDFWIQGAECLK